MPQPRARAKTEGWIHPLFNGRAEIFLKVTGADGETEVKLRATGPESEMGELIDWFERTTGRTVQLPETHWRIIGREPSVSHQTNLFDTGTSQLSSQDATVPDDG
jgi:hypothetical protein